MYRSRKDLARRQMWLFASPEASATTDMEIQLEDGRIVPVHKAILVSEINGVRSVNNGAV